MAAWLQVACLTHAGSKRSAIQRVALQLLMVVEVIALFYILKQTLYSFSRLNPLHAYCKNSALVSYIIKNDTLNNEYQILGFLAYFFTWPVYKRWPIETSNKTTARSKVRPVNSFWTKVCVCVFVFQSVFKCVFVCVCVCERESVPTYVSPHTQTHM